MSIISVVRRPSPRASCDCRLFQSSVALHHVPRETVVDDSTIAQRLRHYVGSGAAVSGERTARNNRAREPVKYLPESGQVVRVLADWQTPKEIFPDGSSYA